MIINEHEIIIYENLLPNEKVIKKPKTKYVLNIATEPEEVRQPNKWIIDRQHEFDFILTNDNEILSKCKNSIFYIMGGCWVHDFDFNNNKKDLSISFLITNKQGLQGYNLRNELWKRQNEIKVKKQFYYSSRSKFNSVDYNLEFGNTDRKNKLFQNISHSIVIENVIRENWFTEKLIDCFFTKTIPLYIGCINIEKFFNSKGMIVCKNVDDIINTCNNLTIEEYNNKLEYIEENYNRSLIYHQNINPVNNRIENLLKENFDKK